MGGPSKGEKIQLYFYTFFFFFHPFLSWAFAEGRGCLSRLYFHHAHIQETKARNPHESSIYQENLTRKRRRWSVLCHRAFRINSLKPGIQVNRAKFPACANETKITEAKLIPLILNPLAYCWPVHNQYCCLCSEQAPWHMNNKFPFLRIPIAERRYPQVLKNSVKITWVIFDSIKTSPTSTMLTHYA